MSNVDIGLLRAAGMNSARAAVVLRRTRQTVSRGIKQPSVGYFKDADVQHLYAAVDAETPALLPGLREYIRSNYKSVAELVGISQISPPFEERAKSARLAWLLLTDFRIRQQEIWPSVRNLMALNRLAIDVFVDDGDSYRAFCALGESTLADIRNANKKLQAQVKLWDPIPVIGLLTRPTVVFDPFEADKVTAYQWVAGAYEAIPTEEAARLVSVFLGRVTGLRREGDEVTIRRLGHTEGDKSETINKAAWADYLTEHAVTA